MSKFSRVAFAALAFLTVGATDLHGPFNGPCPRCRDAADVRRASRVTLPTNAILYFRAGEFATYVPVYLIDLDIGEVSSFEYHSANVTTLGSLSPAQLDKVRKASLRAWQLRPPQTFYVTPGANMELSVLSGSRMVTFEPDERDIGFLTAAVDDAIKSVGKPQ